ncbi:MAG: HDOD domain-containing protein [Vampirovibrionales bacterium]
MNGKWKYIGLHGSRKPAPRPQVQHSQREDAFSAGLLHDIGEIVLSVYCNDVYGKSDDGHASKQSTLHGPAFSELNRRWPDPCPCRGRSRLNGGNCRVSFIDTIRHYHSSPTGHRHPELVYGRTGQNCLRNGFN